MKASELLKKQAGTSTDLMFDYSLSTDKRDRRFMPTSGYLTFYQELPFMLIRPYLKNNFSTSHYKEFNEDIVGALKFSASAINGLDDDDVRLSKRLFLSTKDYEVLNLEKLAQKMEMIL